VKKVAALPGLFGGDGTLLTGTTEQGLAVWLVDAPHLYDRKGGGPYLGLDGTDWPDNHLRFGALSWVGAQLAMGRIGSWKPDLVHLHDWQAALTAGYLHFDRERKAAPPTLLTIHNLAFQGLFEPETRRALKLPVDVMRLDGMEYWSKLSFLKAGVQWSTHLSTVSPTYAREILTPEEGMGFDGLLRLRAHELTGIVNGIDDGVWNPATDPFLATPFSSRRLPAKALNKTALQVELGLHVRTDVPLFGVVSRLTTQKGLDLLLAALPRIAATGAQMAVLGTGDPELEAGYRAAAATYPGQVATVVGFDEALSHRMQAGSDGVLMPSRFEPCGLGQMYAQSQASLPIAYRTGGLADTITDGGDGFLFSTVSEFALKRAVGRAFRTYWSGARFETMRQNALSKRFDWTGPAGRYSALYAAA
jgi:starch synthase